MVQFPWRFLSIQALFAAAVTSYVIRPTSYVLRPVCCVLAAVVLAAAVLVPLRPDRLPIGPADVTAARLQLYEFFAGNIGATIRYEWLPQTVNPRPYTSEALVEPDAPDRAIPLDGATLEATLVERGPIRQTWLVKGDGGDVAFPLHLWPGWQAWVNGERAPVWAVDGSGYLALTLPPGEHTVTLKLGRTPARWLAELVSLATLLGVLAFALVQGRGLARKRRSICPRSPALLVLCLVCLLFCPLSPALLTVTQSRVGVALDRIRSGQPGPSSLEEDLSGGAVSDLTMDFVQMPYLHHNPEGVDFGGEATLNRYSLSAPTSVKTLSPGDRLAIALDWSYTGGPYTATVRLVSPAAVRNDGIGPLAETSARLTSSPSRLALRLPEDLARGVYLLQLHLADAGGALPARTPQGSEWGAAYLQPIRVPHGPTLPEDLSALAHFGPSIRLHGAQISQSADGRLHVSLTWSARHPIAANYSLSLRLVNDEGRVVRQSDFDQLGYGFLPTSGWRSGEKIVDRYTLSSPAGAPAEAGGYHMLVILYLRSTGASIGQARLGDFSLPLAAPFEARRPPRYFTLPALERPLAVNFGDEIRLAGYDLDRAQDALHLTLWWQAVEQPADDYTVFVHCFDPATGENVVQHDASPRNGAYPTSWWAAGEVVSETLTLSLAGVPAGAYRLALGLYDRTVTRLPAFEVDEEDGGQRLSDDRLILPPPVVVEE